MTLRETLKKELSPDPGRFLRIHIRSPFGFGTRWFRQRWQQDLRAVLTQIDAIVRVNAPLPEGLIECSLDAPNARTVYVLRTLSLKTAAGMGLADAMDHLGRWFPSHYIAQIRAGEQTGQLAPALRSLVDGINLDFEHGRTLRNHVVYFSCLLVVEFLILSFLTWKVFPVFTEILDEFDEFDQTAPYQTRVMGWVSEYSREHWLGILAAAGLLVLFLIVVRMLYRVNGVVQSVITALALSIPGWRGLFRDTQIQRLSRGLELRLGGGFALPQALRDTAREGLPRPYRRALERCANKVEQGAPLSHAVAAHPWLLSAQFPELVRLGESREDLVWAFHEAADLCGRSAQRARRVWAEALVPVGVGLCAIGVILSATSTFTMFTAIADAISADL